MTSTNPGGGTGMDPKIAGLLTYLLGWVTGLIFLLIEKDDSFVKFHAWQSVLVFGGLTVISIVLTSTFLLVILLPLVTLAVVGFRTRTRSRGRRSPGDEDPPRGRAS